MYSIFEISKRAVFGGLVAAAIVALSVSAPAVADPVKLRVGHGNAVEEQLWLMKARPDLTPNQGKLYTLEFTRFRGTDKRFQAFEAGALDIATGSANSVIFAASEGVKFKVVASLSMESKRGFYTQYMVRADSGITSLADLKGKTVGLNGFKSSIHLWAMLVLRKAGLDPDRDVTFIPVRFPAHGEALRAGKIDVGAFPQPFARIQHMKGGVKTLFTSKDAVPFDEELMVLVAKPDLLRDQADVVRGYLADLVACTKYYLANANAARQSLIDAKMTRIPAKVYMDMPDYYRDANGRVDVEALRKMQDSQIAAGWQRNRIEVADIVDMSFLPR